MKNLILVLVFFLCQQAYSQIVDIPDINFKKALIDQGVDSNGDGEIQLSEALATDTIKVDNRDISSLEGVKSFVNVYRLICYDNNLTSLDLDGLTKLIFVFCSNNQLNSLNVQGLKVLQLFSCNNNQLNDLNVQGLIQLTSFDCNNNKISSLNVQGLTKMSTLDCSNNQLTNLDVQGLISLDRLNCNNNKLTSLNVIGLTKLKNLNCHFNQITSLDLRGLSALKSLNCYNNHLEYIYFKTGYAKSINFTDNSNLKFICCDDFDIASITSQAVTNGLVNCAVNTYCSFTPGGNFYTIKGENKLDLDNNGCDGLDSAYPNLKFSISDGNITSTIIPNKTGKYMIPVFEGTHLIIPLIVNTDYFTSSPKYAEVTFPDAGDSLIQNFCITPNGVFHDMKISIIPISSARPGFDAKYKIIYKNQGTQTEGGAINFAFDDAILNFINADISPDAQSTGLLSWNFTSLKPFESRSINLILNLNSTKGTPPVHLGDILSYKATVSIPNLDETPGDNIYNFSQTVIGSFDPNDKTCLEGNTIPPSKTGQYVHYLVRFENTGTYAAENVVVKDVIDNKVFIVESLQITDASHKMFTRINGNVVEFIFEDIQLPFDDANNDGYVAFEIKTRPNLKIGDVLKNKAEIYFDYNLPIITNEAQTLVKNAVRTIEAKELAIDFYPNPAKDHVKFLINDQIEKAQVYDLNGKILRSTSVSNNELNIQELQNGTYLVRLFTKNNVYIAKVVKM